ncbi:hypothetical protein AB4Z09_29090, partial [Rhodococcus sp. TAF43]|uniref:hypothetical protein n=1 Tax=Rhodococcus sp. TAF43 TaxID=3237483 RepID=UPI003F9DC3FB
VLPADAVKMIELAQLFHVDDAVCTVLLNGDQLMKFSIDPHPHQDDENLDIIYDCAYDLDVVQRHLHTSFYLPDEFSVEDRINLRIARILIEGHLVQSIQFPTVTATMSGSDSPEIRRLLTETTRLEAPVDYSFRLGNRTINLGTVTIYHPTTHATNGTGAIAALDAGTAANFEVQLAPQDSPYFYIYLPEALRQHEHPYIAEWTLRGITQPGTENE